MSVGVESGTGNLRKNGALFGALLTFVVLVTLAVRWIASNRQTPTSRKAAPVVRVNVMPQPQAVKPLPPPPPPVAPPKVVEETRTTRVEIKPTDMMPPDAPKPASEAPSGGRLSLAAEGEGPGDAFNLVGNPGGRGLLSGGGLGDGSGDGNGDGLGTDDSNAGRFGWYYAKIAAEIEEVFRKQKRLTTAAARVELRIWADGSGRIGRVQLIKSTGNLELDEALQSVVGLRLKEPPPADIPMPMIARFTARRPQ